MKAVTASIVHEDPYMAGRQTAFELMGALAPGDPGGGAPDVVLAFVSSVHAPERVLEGLWSRLPKATRLLGCSSFAEIGAEDALSGSVTAMGFQFQGVEWEIFKLDEVEGARPDAGRVLGQRMLAFDPKLVIVLPDGAAVNSWKLVRGLREVLGPDRHVMGGVASDHLEFQRTFELHDREVLRGGVVALGLRGALSVATVAKAGFQPVGATRTCTRIEDDHLLLELDGVSALSLYKAFLGPSVVDRPGIGLEFPIALISGGAGDYMASDERVQVIRAVRRFEEERGALFCGGDVPEGARIRMTRATKGDLIDAAVLAAHEVMRSPVGSPRVAFLFNCVGRKLVLGGRYHEEIRAAFSVLGPEIAKIGFYTYGEIAPANGVTTYHNETFTAVLLGVT